MDHLDAAHFGDSARRQSLVSAVPTEERPLPRGRERSAPFRDLGLS